ncbi:helix-turn-helix domain-containing protein [Salinifilum ghardaiensis]
MDNVGGFVVVNARPTVERRQLGLALRRFREEVGCSQLEAAQRIGRSDARVSRVEEGLATLGPGELTALLDLYGVGGADREAVQTLGVQSRQRQPRRPYVDSLPGAYQRLSDLEAAATGLFAYEAGVVPGLLQTPDYMDALFQAAEGVWWQPAGSNRQSRARFRARRQEAMWDSGTVQSVHFVLGEAALDELVGDRSVMTAQMDRLLATGAAEGVTVQVLPCSVPNNPALGGGLTLLEFGDAVPRVGFASVVHGPSAYFDTAEDTEAMFRTLQRLEHLALDVRDTADAIAEKRKEWAR